MSNWMSKRGDPNRDAFMEQSASRPNVFRFFMKQGEEKEVIFIDDDEVTLAEHNLKFGEKDFQTYTCGQDKCAFCIDDDFNVRRRSIVQCFTIFDLTPYKNKEGKTVNGSRRMLAVKGEAQQKMLQRRRDNVEGRSLIGKKVRITRDGEKSPASGSDFEVVGEVDLKKLDPKLIQKIDWDKTLSPLSYQQMEAVIAKYKRTAHNGFGGGPENQSVPRDDFGQLPAPSSDDDIPF